MHNKYENMSKQELINELQELQSQFDFLDYQSSYENGYWLNFVIDLIMEGKIHVSDWSSRMPQVDPYPELIDAFTERLKNKPYTLTKEELEQAQQLHKERDEQRLLSQQYERELLREQLRSKAETKH